MSEASITLQKANFIFFFSNINQCGKTNVKERNWWYHLTISWNLFVYTCIFFSDFFSKCLLKKVQNLLWKKTRKSNHDDENFLLFLHNVEITEFLCHPVFTWNQFWRFLWIFAFFFFLKDEVYLINKIQSP